MRALLHRFSASPQSKGHEGRAAASSRRPVGCGANYKLMCTPHCSVRRPKPISWGAFLFLKGSIHVAPGIKYAVDNDGVLIDVEGNRGAALETDDPQSRPQTVTLCAALGELGEARAARFNPNGIGACATWPRLIADIGVKLEEVL